MSTIILLNRVTATGAGQSVNVLALRTPTSNRTFQAIGTTSTGSGAASVKIQVSNDNTNWIDMGTISLTLSTTVATDGFVSDANWTYVRANLSSVSGTNATVTVYMGLV